jgi:DNA-binding MarR family transcriptional regulator
MTTVVQLTEAQRAALRWLREHNGDGVFDVNHVLLAAGENAPVMRSTWNKLSEAGFVEFYQDRKRLRLVVCP